MAVSFSFPFYVIGEKPRRFSIFNFRHVLPIFNFNFLSPVYGSSVKRNSTSRYFAKPSKFKWHTFWKFQFPPRWIISCAKHGEPGYSFRITIIPLLVNLYQRYLEITKTSIHSSRINFQLFSPFQIHFNFDNSFFFIARNLASSKVKLPTPRSFLRDFEPGSPRKDLQLLKWRNLGYVRVYVRAIAISRLWETRNWDFLRDIRFM